MSEDTPKPIKTYGKQKAATFMPPATTGSMKRDPWHMSIDELIEYKSTGVAPKLILNPEKIYTLAKSGVSIKNICQIFGVSESSFMSNDTFCSAHASGRGDIATKNRAAIVEQAKEGSLMAQMYLDKLMGGDIEKTEHIFTPAAPKEVTEAEDIDLLKALKNGNRTSD